MFTSVLLPLDGSRLSEQAIDYAVEVAERFHAPVRLLYAYEGMNQLADTFARIDGDLDRGEWEQMHRSTEQAMARVQRYLDDHVQRLSARGVQASATIADAAYGGAAAGVILEEARRVPGTVIVMTTHGRSGWRRALFGSTAQEVLEKAPVPVLLIRITDDSASRPA